MILVTCGTERFGFDRLVRHCDVIVPSDQGGMVQLGSTKYRPSRLMFTEYMPFDQMCLLMRQASAIVMHAGAGSLLTCLGVGRVPILVPRRAEFGEHVDNHQVEFAARVEREFGIPVCWDPERLEFAAVAAAGERQFMRARDSSLTDYLDDALRRGIEKSETRKAGGWRRLGTGDAALLDRHASVDR